MRCIAALISLWVSTAEAAQTLPAIVDPIFKLSLPAALYTREFAEAPQGLLERCGLKVSKAYGYRDWILASASEAGARYMLLTGVLRKGGKWETDAKGAFVRVTEDGCTALDPAEGVFLAPADAVPQEVYTSLKADLVRSFAGAYGSKRQLVEALKGQHRYPLAPELSQLRLE